MKRSQIFTIAACAIAAIFFTAVLAIGLNSDPAGSAPVSDAPRTYTNSETFDLEEYSIDSLDVDWLTGPVTVGISPDDKVHVTERSSRALNESERMAVETDAGTLTIRWDGQWFRKFFNVNLTGWFGMTDKELEVLLPRDVVQTLITVDVENVSDKLDITGCTAEKISVSTVSGTIAVSSCTAENLAANSVSGDVAMNDISASDAMTVNTVSGGMELAGISAGGLTLDTVSGICTLGGRADELNVSTISGDIAASLLAQPGRVDMNSVSGALKLELPSTAGFTVEHDSVSGSFGCAFPTEDLGGRRLRCGSGGADIRMNTTSGNMDIRRREI